MEVRLSMQEENKLWTPKVVQGGKTDPPNDNEPWLTRIEIGTVFLTQNKKEPIICSEWQKIDWRLNVSKLAHPANLEQYIWVVDRDFSLMNNRMAILRHE